MKIQDVVIGKTYYSEYYNIYFKAAGRSLNKKQILGMRFDTEGWTITDADRINYPDLKEEYYGKQGYYIHVETTRELNKNEFFPEINLTAEELIDNPFNISFGEKISIDEECAYQVKKGIVPIPIISVKTRVLI